MFAGFYVYVLGLRYRHVDDYEAQSVVLAWLGCHYVNGKNDPQGWSSQLHGKWCVTECDEMLMLQ